MRSREEVGVPELNVSHGRESYAAGRLRLRSGCTRETSALWSETSTRESAAAG
jgi:hypothetical protein